MIHRESGRFSYIREYSVRARLRTTQQSLENCQIRYSKVRHPSNKKNINVANKFGTELPN